MRRCKQIGLVEAILLVMLVATYPDGQIMSHPPLVITADNSIFKIKSEDRVQTPPQHRQRSNAVSQCANQENAVLGFLNGTAADIHGRTFDNVMAFSDEQIEHTYNFIQWLFPLPEPSLSVPGSPRLSNAEITAIKDSIAGVANLNIAADWFLDLLVRNQHWIKPYDHNHLRITRVIKSLRLLSADEEADQFKAAVIELAGDGMELIDVRATQFWEDA